MTHEPFGYKAPFRLALLIGPILGLCLSVAAGAEPSVLARALTAMDQAIAETQEALDRVLTSYDPEAIAAVGRRLRDLKRRRDQLAAEIAAQTRQEEIAETTRLVRQRETMRQRLADLERQVRAAAADFDANPEAGRAAQLRDLNLEIIGLKEDLQRAEAAARESGRPQAPGGAAPEPARRGP